MKNEKLITPGFLSGVYLSYDEDVLLKLQAVQHTNGSVSAYLRYVLRNHLAIHETNTETTIDCIVQTLVTDWRIEKLRCQSDPGRELSFSEFLKTVINTTLKKLPPDVTKQIIEKLKNETNKLK